MRAIICFILASLFLTLMSGEVQAGGRKKKKEISATERQAAARQKLSAYERLFQGKEVHTAEGFMKIHAVREKGKEKILAEFPLRLLNREMLLTVGIRETSDPGEGAVGQFGNYVQVRFNRQDSVLLLQLTEGDKVVAALPDSTIREAFAKAGRSGIWQVFPVLAHTPDSSAVVVDLTPLLMEHTPYVSPFAKIAGNAMGGFAQREPHLRKELTVFRDVRGSRQTVSVTAEYHYFVDHKMMGQQMFRKNVPVSIVANRILMLLPEEPMQPRLADMRVGVTLLNKKMLLSKEEGFRDLPYILRWRLEPSDKQKYERGELVEPLKPIVFYLDTLVPASWKQAVVDAATAWNPVFEAIGFKNVIRIKEFPVGDPEFDAENIEYSTIRFGTTWLYGAHNSLCVDLRTGEILSSSIILHNSLETMVCDQYRVGCLGLDPVSRTNGDFPDSLRYELIKNNLIPMFGNVLGLRINPKAMTAFPLDSLRSPGFTQKYGFAPSVMLLPYFNTVVRPEDVAKGVRLLPKGPGECDYFTVKWMYQPLFQAKTPVEEVPFLEAWVEQQTPNCRFGYPNMLMTDVTRSAHVPGKEHLEAFKAYLENLRNFFAHVNDWYSEGDEDFSKRRVYISNAAGEFSMILKMLVNYIGGFSVNYTSKGTFFDYIPKEQQQEVVRYCLKLTEQLEWLDVPQFEQEAGLMNNRSRFAGWNIFNELLGRQLQLFFSEEKNPRGYTFDEFIDEFYQYVWAPTLKGRSLSPMQRELQSAFLGCLISSSNIVEDPRSQAAARRQAANRKALASALECRFYDGNYFLPFDRPLAFGTTPAEADGNLYQPEFSDLKTAPYPEAHRYFALLQKTRILIRKALGNASGKDRMHYEYLLRKIRDVLDLN